MLISKLNDSVLEKSLGFFLQKVHHYFLHDFNISILEIEQLNKQFLLFSWALQSNKRLIEYNTEINILLENMKSAANDNLISSAQFLDMPRPPVFFAYGNIYECFGQMVLKMKQSSKYTEAIGIELGIHNLEYLM